jgi:hypothetical protein
MDRITEMEEENGQRSALIRLLGDFSREPDSSQVLPEAIASLLPKPLSCIWTWGLSRLVFLMSFLRCFWNVNLDIHFWKVKLDNLSKIFFKSHKPPRFTTNRPGTTSGQIFGVKKKFLMEQLIKVKHFSRLLTNLLISMVVILSPLCLSQDYLCTMYEIWSYLSPPHLL